MDPKAFQTWKQGNTQFIAIPNGPNFSIADEHGNNYGAWMSVENYRKAVRNPSHRMHSQALTPVGKTALAFKYVGEA